ncbi:major facilitator superfamily domain-containing protein [Pseudoneurospora amorphoporcata]|uniref:Major facilitator superfamily domain-containing protein n=1 Tax=Pseudoneurospora amorphoporcata TaxID=241081 RepID=A0AAN6NP27_9PEZI|nr:major facilitator superfamily domain-containing protein [Pseudoneurospora amorphoporcata]
MSLNRVSSLETFAPLLTENRSRRSSDASTRNRKITFNPLPAEWDPPALEQIQAVGAFEVPKWKRTLQVVVAVTYSLFAAGIVFGYAAIKPVLKREGAYQHVCQVDDEDAISQDTCVEIHLNLMFTTAAVATNVAALPVGAILDRHGPRVCGLLGALSLAIGALFMAFENKLPFDGLLFGYLFLALGGPFTYISSFQLSNAFPKNSGLILALLTGAFDASSALFLVYRIIYEQTNESFGHQSFFLAYLVVPAAIAVFQFVLMPAQSYKTVGELVEEIEEPITSDLDPYHDQIDEETAFLHEEERQHRADVVSGIQELLGTTKADKQAKTEERKNEISGVWGAMHAYTAWEQIKSPWFILICLFTVVQMTRINYFVATIRVQYTYLLSSPLLAERVNDFFDLALPLGGILSIPFIGAILDRTSTVTVLTTLVATATAIGILGVIPHSMLAAYANVCLFVLYRPFYYTAVSDYSAKVFGFRTFGTVYGTIICFAGLLNFSQSGLDYLLHETFGGDPVPVNLGLMATGLLIGVVMVLFVGIRARGIKRKLLEEEARRAFGGSNRY